MTAAPPVESTPARAGPSMLPSVVLTCAVATWAVISAAVLVLTPQACVAPAAAAELALGCRCDPSFFRRLS